MRRIDRNTCLVKDKEMQNDSRAQEEVKRE